MFKYVFDLSIKKLVYIRYVEWNNKFDLLNFSYTISCNKKNYLDLI